MKLVTWKFKDGKSHMYDRNTFKKKVKQLLYRVKPKGFSLLNLDFTRTSESVYVIFVSNKSNNSYMFRISSHETFSDNKFWTYNTNEFDSFKSLEQKIQQDLANRNPNLSFTFDLEDYLFYMGALHLHRQKKHFVIEKNFFKKNKLEPHKRKILIKNKKELVDGVITSSEYLDLVQKVIEKGYITGHPQNKVYSLVVITNLFHQLAKHYKNLYANQLKKIDFNLYFDILMDTKNLIAKRDLGGKSYPEVDHFWNFKNQYFIGNFDNYLKEIIHEIPENLKLLNYEFNDEKKYASIFLVLTESPDSFINLIISSKKIKLLHNYKAFRTIDYYDVTLFEQEISQFLTSLQLSMFKRLKRGDYLELKKILTLDKKKKFLMIPSNLTNETLSKLEKIYIVEKRVTPDTELIDDLEKIDALRRVLVTGLATLVPVDEKYSKVIVTESAKKLMKEIEALNPLPDEFVIQEDNYSKAVIMEAAKKLIKEIEVLNPLTDDSVSQEKSYSQAGVTEAAKKLIKEIEVLTPLPDDFVSQEESYSKAIIMKAAKKLIKEIEVLNPLPNDFVSQEKSHSQASVTEAAKELIKEIEILNPLPGNFISQEEKESVNLHLLKNNK